MKAQIYINLPVKNLEESMNFYMTMGFTNEPKFSDTTAKCMVFSEEIFVMLLTHDKFKSFTLKPIADATKTIAVILSLSVESVEKMNEIVDRAISGGGKEPVEPKDYGFMQLRTIEDLDGHTWEIFFMDTTKIPS